MFQKAQKRLLMNMLLAKFLHEKLPSKFMLAMELNSFGFC